MKTRNRRGDKANPKDLAKQTPMITGAITLGIGALGAGEADAALVIQDINLTSGEQTIDGGFVEDDPFTFDLDQDGSDDFRVVNQTPYQKNAFIVSTEPLVKTTVTGVATFGVIDFETDPGDGTVVVVPVTQNEVFVDENGFTTLFAPGDEVDGGDGPASDSADFFRALEGPFSNIGATGYIGLKLQLETGTHYGWLEVTRGSITAGQAGFQTTPGAAAPIPGGMMNPAGVPEPGGIPMLAAGAAGIALLKRRRKQKSA